MRDQKVIFEDAGFEPIIGFQSENDKLNFDMCRLDLGAYVATRDTCCRCLHSDAKEGHMLIYPIDTSIDPVVIALSYRKGKTLTRADCCFIQAAKEYLKNNPV